MSANTAESNNDIESQMFRATVKIHVQRSNHEDAEDLTDLCAILTMTIVPYRCGRK
jgi:hypothetical protein